MNRSHFPSGASENRYLFELILFFIFIYLNIHMFLTGTISSDCSEHGNYGNEGRLYTPQSSKSGNSRTVTVLNRRLWHNGTKYTFGPPRLDECSNSILVTNPKIYLLLSFVSSRWAKESEYESWVDRASRTKRNMSWRERENRHRRWTFFLVFCCSSSMLVRMVVSSLRPLWNPPPKLGS